MKIALTGPTGFIGKRLLKKLEEVYGNSSICIISSREINGFESFLYDEDKELISTKKIDCDILIHAGAYTPKSASEANNVQKCNSNINFTQSLLEKIDLTTCKKIINLSTLDVYNSDGIIDEKTLVAPSTLYGMSKFYCEEMLNHFTSFNNISLLNLRIGHVYGVGEENYKKVLPVTISKMINSKPIEIWGDGRDLRSFIHVDDVVDSILNSIEKDIKERVINVVSGNKISIRDLIETLIIISKKDVELMHISSNSPRRDLVFDNSILKENLLPKERDFYTGLVEEYNYMLELN